MKAGKENTSELESFHAALNRNAPKMISFSDSGQLSRLVLGAYIIFMLRLMYRYKYLKNIYSIH